MSSTNLQPEEEEESKVLEKTVRVCSECSSKHVKKSHQISKKKSADSVNPSPAETKDLVPKRGILIHKDIQEAINPYWYVTKYQFTLKSINKEWKKWVRLKTHNIFVKLLKKVRFSREKPIIYTWDSDHFCFEDEEQSIENSQTEDSSGDDCEVKTQKKVTFFLE